MSSITTFHAISKQLFNEVVKDHLLVPQANLSSVSLALAFKEWSCIKSKLFEQIMQLAKDAQWFLISISKRRIHWR